MSDCCKFCIAYNSIINSNLALNVSAAAYLMNQFSAERRLGAVAGHLAAAPVTVTVGGVTVSVTQGGASACPASGATTSSHDSHPTESASPASASAPTKLKEYDLAEVAKHNKDTDCWVVVNGQVLDATNFLADHPGGKKAIMIYAGRDATEECKLIDFVHLN